MICSYVYSEIGFDIAIGAMTFLVISGIVVMCSDISSRNKNKPKPEPESSNANVRWTVGIIRDDYLN